MRYNFKVQCTAMLRQVYRGSIGQRNYLWLTWRILARTTHPPVTSCHFVIPQNLPTRLAIIIIEYLTVIVLHGVERWKRRSLSRWGCHGGCRGTNCKCFNHMTILGILVHVRVALESALSSGGHHLICMIPEFHTHHSKVDSGTR